LSAQAPPFLERFLAPLFAAPGRPAAALLVYWSMADALDEATLINRWDEDQTCEARRAAGTLPIP